MIRDPLLEAARWLATRPDASLQVHCGAAGGRLFHHAARPERKRVAASSQVALSSEHCCGQECPRADAWRQRREAPGEIRRILVTLRALRRSIY
jgi:hypothetical protein